MIPRISVVIPTYNREHDLKRAIESVFGQTFHNWEIIVVDNHSIDGTDALVHSFKDSRIILFKIKNDGVIAASRNLGIQHARGEYIAFLDSDDWWKPKKLAESIYHLDKGYDLVYHDLFRILDTKRHFVSKKLKSMKLGKNAYQDLLLNGNGILNSSVVLRKSILQTTGLLNTERKFIAWEDFDLWLRIAKHYYRMKKIDGCLGYYWQVGGNLSNHERSLNIFKYFLDVYSEDLQEVRIPPWISFARGKIYFSTQQLEEATRHFKAIKLNQFRFFWKSCLFRILIFYYIIVNK